MLRRNHPLLVQRGRIAGLLLLFLLMQGCAARRPPSLSAPTLQGDCAEYRSAALTQELDRLTRSEARGGNRVELLINGAEAFRRRFENAQTADVIFVKTFIFSDDEVGNQVADLLIARAQAGAYVVLQYDVKGSIGGLDDLTEMFSRASSELPFGEKAIVRRMREGGVVIVPTNSPSRGFEAHEWVRNLQRLTRNPAAAVARALQTMTLIGHCDHEKYWITGQYDELGRLELRAIMGGMNIASEYAYGGLTRVDAGSKRGGWRDTDIEVRGPVVNDIVDRFIDAMDYHLGWQTVHLLREQWNVPQPPAGEATARFVWNHPLISNQHTIPQLYSRLIQATPAGSPVNIQTAYFAPGYRIRRSLEAALRRGTNLTILSNSKNSIDVAMVAEASRYFYYRLLKVNETPKLLERLPRPDIGEFTLHAKAASFGHCGPVIVGSANLDAQSSVHNSESVLLVDDAQLRRRFDVMFEEDIREDRAYRVTLELVRSSPVRERLRQWSWHFFAWYWL